MQFVVEKALPLHGRVLDVGTGKGRFVIPLARHVANVTTVDISAEEQRQARLEAIYAGVADRIRFVIQDARFLPWPAGSFNAVVSWNVFHHLDDPERVFGEMLRVLKPGGKLVLAILFGFALHRMEFTPLGTLRFFLGAVHLAHSHPASLGAALAFCAGTFLYIACADLLPQLQCHSHDHVTLSLALLTGIAVPLLTARFGHATYDHLHNQSMNQLPPLTSGLNPPAAAHFVMEANLALSKPHRLQCSPLWMS